MSSTIREMNFDKFIDTVQTIDGPVGHQELGISSRVALHLNLSDSSFEQGPQRLRVILDKIFVGLSGVVYFIYM
jgi:hypothetical protein